MAKNHIPTPISSSSEVSSSSAEDESKGSESEEGHDSSDSVEVIVDSMRSTSLRECREYKVPKSLKAKMAAKEWDSDRDYHESLVLSEHSSDSAKLNVHEEEIRTTPLFSADVLACVNATRPNSNLLRQYGFLAKVLDTFGGDQQSTDDLSAPNSENSGVALNSSPESAATKMSDSRLFLNMNTPWSAFICGSQGSGKSHTLSCILEAALQPSKLGKLPSPLAGMIFHYDKFTGFSSTQVCEAAYLCSTGIPVTVLVSPSNFRRMERAYRNIRDLPSNAPKPVVAPLLLEERHLNVERMMKLMAIDEKEGKISLYMESVCRILRSMAMKNQHTSGLNYTEFKDRLSMERFNDGQQAMLATRLQLLESFMVQPGVQVNDAKPSKHADTKKAQAERAEWQNKEDARERAKIAKSGIWSFKPGSLTIVDLSCPFVDESAACVMFNICLALFLEDREKAGRIVALDEAHKFMTGTESSSTFTESLLSVIRQQRHLATRVIIATQEPTISPSLLDLCSMTIVHRFTSRAWLTALQSHLAAVSSEGESSKQGVQDVFKQIVELEAGQGLIFSPSAMVGVDDDRKTRMLKLGIQYIKVLIRQRTTADGGRSILAT